MMTGIRKRVAHAVALAAVASLAACSGQERDDSRAGETQALRGGTMAAALRESPELSTVAGAVVGTDLNTLFDGVASYTLLAPTNDAFAALGARGDALLGEEQRPLLVAVLRDHILPGHLRPEDIAAAIEARGQPVRMTTLGGDEVTFAREGDAITVTRGDGSTARLTGSAIAASNGVVIPVGAVLPPQ